MKKSYATGLLFIFIVAIIWAAASVLVQYIYQQREFNSPFLLTYIGVSLFTLWLPFRCITEFLSKMLQPMNSDSQIYQSVTSEVLDDDSIVENSSSAQGEESEIVSQWTEEDHIHVALRISPVWFMANWTYNGSLAFTSITAISFLFASTDHAKTTYYSSTVLASTGSLFTFMFALIAKDEKFGYMKLIGVVLGIFGSCATALNDASPPNEENDNSNRPILGDLLGLVSAVGYGAYAVQTRVLCPRDESLYSMQLILGYIGLTNMLALSPIAIYQILYKTELPLEIFGMLVVKGLFDNVISDYLWLRAVILTNATVATVGLGLTIPLAFLSDIILEQADVLSPGALFGAFAVLAGFVLVNLETASPSPTSAESNGDIRDVQLNDIT